MSYVCYSVLSTHLVKFEPSKRKRKATVSNPKFLFSNLCSLNNKLEELSILLNQHQIDIGVFVESWLSKDIPDDAVAINGYMTFRKDRDNGTGGGIVCYSKLNPPPTVILSESVFSLNSCKTEFLPLFFNKLSLLVIGVYHPFWNAPRNHDDAINCITDIIDYVAVNLDFDSYLRVVLLGDFNDLRGYSKTISSVTQLKPHVTFLPGVIISSTNCLLMLMTTLNLRCYHRTCRPI